MSKKPLAIALFGPTACNKTETAIQIALKFKGEIISFDSVQIYQGLDIGSAKPSLEEQKIIPHYLIDWVKPHKKLSVFEVVQKALNYAHDIMQRKKIPIFCGGTGLYFKALFNGLFEGPTAQPHIRQKIRQEAKEKGVPFLHQKLKKIDKKRAEEISENDLIRIERALEVYYSTGKTLSEFYEKQKYEPDFHFLNIGLNYPREELYSRIEKRVDLMIAQGLLEETKKLHQEYPQSLVLQSSIGYKELLEVLLNNTDLEKAILQIKQNTRRFAKRQNSLFKSFNNTFWSIPPNLSDIFLWLEEKIGQKNEG